MLFERKQTKEAKTKKMQTAPEDEKRNEKAGVAAGKEQMRGPEGREGGGRENRAITQESVLET